MIQFENVTRRYGSKVAVSDFSLSISSGELFALLGPNGSGKTTTVKMLVGLLRPSSGAAKVCGFDVTDQTRESNRGIGYVPDEPHLYDKLTGREFLRFIADMYGLDASQGAFRFSREIQQFELGEFVDDLTESCLKDVQYEMCIVLPGKELH